jgi:gliding motility-associated-like protein
MKSKIIIILSLILIYKTGFNQTAAGDCSDAEAGCETVIDGFPIVTDNNDPLYNIIDEAGGPNGSNISWPGSNPQGVNSGCMFSGELNPTWISFTILNDGVLEFSLGTAGGSGFFDWIMWQNTDGLACADIYNNVLAPVACNWNASSSGFTGMADPADLPAGASAGNFQPPLNVFAGDQFLICFSNYSNVNGVIVPFDNIGVDSNDPNASGFACSSPTMVLDQLICEGDTATLEVIGVPANITSYSWSPATNISNASGGPIVQVWPTDTIIYTVTMVSPDSTWSNTVTVNVVHVIEPNAGVDDSTCFTNANGYQLQGILYNDGIYNWENSQGPAGSSSVFNPDNITIDAFVTVDIPGIYEFVLYESDTNNVCPDGSDTLLIYYSEETHTSTFIDPTCFGGDDGSIAITSTGTTGAIEYSFNGGSFFTPSSDSINLSAGTYTLITRDIIGCEFTSTVVITDPLEVTLIVGPTPDSTICENGTGTLYAYAQNGNTFDYHWNHTPNLSSIQLITPFEDTIVNVYAENELGCLSDTQSIFIYLHNPITIDYLINDTICPGYDASFTIIPTGGFQGYNYLWTSNGTALNENSNTLEINPEIETEYCVTVSDICESSEKTECGKIIMREVPNPQFVTDIRAGCAPQTITFSDITSYNLAETETDTYTWHIEGTVYNDSSFIHTFENPGDFDVSLEVFTQFGCHNEIDSLAYITIHELPEATFYVISNPTTIFETEVSMINNTLGDNNTYEWVNIGGIPSSSNEEAPKVTYPEGIADDYPVYLYVTNEFGCEGFTEDIVHIIPDVIIYAPNAFTPDGDNLNNEWRVYIDGIDVTEYHLYMFNRWGEIVWESFNPEGQWDGSYNGSLVPDGTYVWSNCKCFQIKDSR